MYRKGWARAEGFVLGCKQGMVLGKGEGVSHLATDSHESQSVCVIWLWFCKHGQVCRQQSGMFHTKEEHTTGQMEEGSKQQSYSCQRHVWTDGLMVWMCYLDVFLWLVYESFSLILPATTSAVSNKKYKNVIQSGTYNPSPLKIMISV